MVIDPREPEVFEGAVAQKLKEPGLGRLRRYAARVDRVEEGTQLQAGSSRQVLG